jgi:hypothetical protein
MEEMIIFKTHVCIGGLTLLPPWNVWEGIVFTGDAFIVNLLTLKFFNHDSTLLACQLIG